MITPSSHTIPPPCLFNCETLRNKETHSRKHLSTFADYHTVMLITMAAGIKRGRRRPFCFMLQPSVREKGATFLESDSWRKERRQKWKREMKSWRPSWWSILWGTKTFMSRFVVEINAKSEFFFVPTTSHHNMALLHNFCTISLFSWVMMITKKELMEAGQADRWANRQVPQFLKAYEKEGCGRETRSNVLLRCTRVPVTLFSCYLMYHVFLPLLPIASPHLIIKMISRLSWCLLCFSYLLSELLNHVLPITVFLRNLFVGCNPVPAATQVFHQGMGLVFTCWCVSWMKSTSSIFFHSLHILQKYFLKLWAGFKTCRKQDEEEKG